MTSDKELYEAHESGATYAEIAERYRLNVNGVRGHISRYRSQVIQRLEARIDELEQALEKRQDEQLYGNDLGTPLMLDGDWMIIGDIHLNTVNTAFMQRPLQVAERYLKRPRQCIIAGDLFNADAFSKYDAIAAPPPFRVELQAARAFFDLYLKTFDELTIIMGNHDYRIPKRTGTAIEPADLIRMVSHDERIHVSQWGHAIIQSTQGDYRVTHGSEYSVNQLTVADQLAQKFHQHIIGHHQHHAALGLDRYKHFVVIDGGGLFDEQLMAYVQLEDSKRPRMANGFVMLLNGFPYIFNDKWTDWSFWLRE